jgi:hypothetical protein
MKELASFNATMTSYARTLPQGCVAFALRPDPQHGGGAYTVGRTPPADSPGTNFR